MFYQICFFFINQDPLRHAHDTKPLPKSAGTSPEAEQDQKTSIFQRSISEIDGCMLDQGDTHFNRVVMRRRNNSGGVSGGNNDIYLFIYLPSSIFLFI